VTDPPDSLPLDPVASPGSTTRLLDRCRRGEGSAREELYRRFLPRLRQWAHGRLPGYARDLADTDDLVQVSLLSALNHLETFEPRREGAFLAYLRRILMNRIRDEIRRVTRRGTTEALPERLEGRLASPLEEVLGRDLLESYEKALARLTEGQQEAVLLRVEFGYTYAEIAEATGAPSEAAARMLVVRGLARLAEELDATR
jgi:RNA polymerase sigma-70 factor (ECF subfamily)